MVRLCTKDFQVKGDVLVALSENGRVLLHTNEVGLELWRKLTLGPLTVEGLIEHLTSVYSVDHDKAKQDVEYFIAEASKYGFIENS